MKKLFPLKLLNLFLMLIMQSVMFAQESGIISGTVKDINGEPVAGVSVVVKNTTNGTITDLDGAFKLNNVNLQTDVLVFSSIGMETQELAIGGQTQIDAVMQESATMLGEVVAIGYGTAKKKDITGSVSSVQGKDLSLIPVSTAAEAMTGKMAGVQVLTTEGSPDAEIKIRVRGGGSLTQDNSPLYIVDGFPVDRISDIPSSDIQSIDVLKDASSTAIYGSRGANGVIIVTTRGGKEGKLSVNYNAYFGIKQIAKKLNVLQVEDFVNFQYEYAALKNGMDDLSSYENYFGPYQDIDLYQGQAGNNWQEQVYGQIGKVFSQDLSIIGGSDKFKYSFSYAGINSKEIMIGSDYNRNNLALKLDHSPNKKIELSFSVRFSNTKINGGGVTEQNQASSADSRLKHCVIYSPIPLNGLSSDVEEAASFLVNPLISIADNDRYQTRMTFNIGGGFAWKITDNLQFKTEIGLDNYDYNDNRFYGLSTYKVQNFPIYPNQPAIILSNDKRLSLRNTNTLHYDLKRLINNKNHTIKLLVGQELIKTEANSLTSDVRGFPTLFDSEQSFRLTTQGKPYSTDNYYSPDDKLISFFGRANYDYLGKYLLSVTFRADGSSKFAEGNQWGYFPSAAVAWRISQENFMDGVSGWLDDLKLRLSYGTAGNNNIESGQMTQVFESTNTEYINGATSYWAPKKTMANPDLKWETTNTRNIGLDFGFFKNRLSGSVEVYDNITNDLLILFPISGTGYQNQYRNMGETENKGLEGTLNWVAIEKPNYGLNFGFNIGLNRNSINSLGIMDDYGMSSGWASTEISDDYWISVGGSVGQMNGYLSDGRYEVSDFASYNETNDTWILNSGVADNSGVIGKLRPGMLKLKDITGDGIVNVDDNTIIGDANPLSTGGFNIAGRFYGFDLSALFSWSYGNDVYNANKIEYTSTSKYQYRNMIDIMEGGKRWNNIDASGNIVNDPAALAELNANTTNWSPFMNKFVFSDWAVEDGSFLRLNTLSLGYTIPTAITKKAHIQSLRFYASCYNVFILTNYSGFDPEVSTRRQTALTPGVDYSAYPRSRQFTFGLNINF